MNQKFKQYTIDMLDVCADRLERMNQIYPQLASEDTQYAVQNWRRRKGEICMQVKEGQKRQGIEMVQNLEQLSRELLKNNSIEDVLDILLQEHGIDISMQKLIKTVGKGVYLSALRKEVSFLRQNGVGFDQIAELWNELDRPGPNSGSWTEASVSLMGQ